jgi:hypothetical protein
MEVDFMTTHTAARLVAVLILFFIVGATAAAAGEAHLYLAPYGFASRFTGDGQVSGNSSGTRFDLEDTLGIDPKDTAAGVDGFVKLLGSRIDFGYSKGSYEGSEKLSDPLVFNDVTYGSGERVRSKIDFTHYRLMYGFDFGLKVVNVGFLIGGHLVDAEARVKSTLSGSEHDTLRAPVPAVGVTLGVHPISKLAIHAQVSGMSVTISSVKAKLIDGFAGVNYLPIPKLGVVAGYRYFVLDAEDKDEQDKVNITQRGPYAGIALHL